MRTQALALLNRSDATDDLMKTFMQLGLQRCQRELRLPHQERLLVIDTSSSTVSEVLVPDDWMETIAFTWELNGEGDEIDYADFGDYVRLKQRTYGRPTYYTRSFDRYKIADPIPQGAVAEFYYYGDEAPLSNDLDSSTLSTIAPDLIIYAALTYAADHFTDDRSTAWEQKWQFFREQLQSQASEGENSNGSNAVEPVATFEDEAY